mmetsp:Transcript_15306/g.21308  ORF Transcript_15306/g.21308 Transcript_15306/m.21308 type:complete len:297 (+) Transcript_15306:97-987(+)|eukprot:CAMPEP_0185259952 /NCGR_PEP_ID=MMETSP1359-20130426/8620_1 /TAXON_ID=552665 /ORGANISM="Bigelowiella longifila, Strain CCMP242" /LENGTH=296 /DNA_ID=CAMNT_0027846031 /DNA_START=122 /DNA_END=1012 /DNA_ORIENTATION=-
MTSIKIKNTCSETLLVDVAKPEEESKGGSEPAKTPKKVDVSTMLEIHSGKEVELMLPRPDNNNFDLYSTDGLHLKNLQSMGLLHLELGAVMQKIIDEKRAQARASQSMTRKILVVLWLFIVFGGLVWFVLQYLHTSDANETTPARTGATAVAPLPKDNVKIAESVIAVEDTRGRSLRNRGLAILAATGAAGATYASIPFVKSLGHCMEKQALPICQSLLHSVRVSTAAREPTFFPLSTAASGLEKSASPRGSFLTKQYLTKVASTVAFGVLYAYMLEANEKAREIRKANRKSDDLS